MYTSVAQVREAVDSGSIDLSQEVPANGRKNVDARTFAEYRSPKGVIVVRVLRSAKSNSRVRADLFDPNGKHFIVPTSSLSNYLRYGTSSSSTDAQSAADLDALINLNDQEDAELQQADVEIEE